MESPYIGNEEIWKELFFRVLGVSFTLRRWLALFGVPPELCCYLYSFLTPKYSRREMLFTLHFLTRYEISEQAACRWRVSEKTLRKKIWGILFIWEENLNLCNLEDRFEQPRLNGLFSTSLLIVDGTECPIERPIEDAIQNFFYSGKKKKHTIKYLVAVRITDGRIVWVSEPAPGRIHDITLYRMHLQPLILPWETLLGDKGFQGEPELITPVKGRTLTPFEKASNTYIGSVRAIIERTIGRIKRFAAVSHVWRHDRALHPVVFKVCANLAQLTMEVAPLVKEPHPFLFGNPFAL